MHLGNFRALKNRKSQKSRPRLGQLYASQSRALQTSRVHAYLVIRTLSMS